MTSEQKQKTSMTLVGVLALLAAIGTGWEHIEPAMSWAVKNLGSILEREQVQAVLASSAFGAFMGAGIPHMLPSQWSPAKTRVVASVIGGLLTFGAALILVSTRTGFVYACLAASATPTVSQALAGLLYVLKPDAKPESLQP